MKNLKKIICTVMALCTVALTGCLGCGTYEFKTDGTYYYDVQNTYCTVTGLKDETQEVLYIPTHFKGKPVTGIGTFKPWGGFSGKLWTIVNYNLKKIYYPYTVRIYQYEIGFVGGSNPENFNIRSFSKEAYFICSLSEKTDIYSILEEYYCQTKKLNREIEPAYGYVTRTFFEREYGEKSGYKQIADCGRHPEAKEDGFEAYVQIANTAYFFNYEEAPNEGYFFINNFEYGSLIEDTPYKPTRNGYNFAGWYKEPECVNKWDFKKDKLHEEKYDEEGNFAFEELGLYAKWTKK